MKKTIRLTESDLHKIIKKTANLILDESYLYTNDINTNDLRVSGHWTEDGYAEWEASVDNGWYTFRGTYNGIDCELDEIIEGHSGYGHQHDIDDEAVEWFNQNLADKVKSWLDNDSNVQTESRKRTVRLTENDLHKVIAESVKKIINEVMVNGQSLHGNDPNAWNTLQQMRKQQYQNSNFQNKRAGSAWMRNFDNKKELQLKDLQQQQKQNQYQPPLISKRMNNGKFMIFNPNRNEPITNMQFDNSDPYMVQGHQSILAMKDGVNYEVFPNGQVQRVNARQQ